MKRLVISSFLCFVAMTVFAQENAQIKVEYTERYQNWTGANKKEKMLLLANSEISHFYNPMTLIVDSMLSTPQGTVQFNSMVEAANAAGQRPSLLPGSRTYVVKNFSERKTNYYGEVAGELGHYEENMEEQKWEITDSTMTILGYECLSAETDYHGRHWRVWFTPEITIHDGPWKLCGLPGIILKADADNGKYRFEATGIEASNKPFPKRMYGHELSKKVNRKDMLNLQWTFYNNSGAQMNAEFGVYMKDEPLPEGFDLIETDYKNLLKNN